MKRSILVFAGLVLSAVIAWATTYHTIVIDGVNDFAGDEDFTTSSGGYTAYFTWDANNLYFGYSGGDVGSGQSANKWIVWYFDTDPQINPKSGNGTDDALSFNTQNWTLPFYADYALQIRTDGGFNQLNFWNGASWTTTTLNATIFDNNAANFIEICLPKSDLGNPVEIYALSYFINEQAFGEFTYASWPDVALDGGDGYKPSGNFSHWYGFRLQPGVSPDAGSNFDQPIPVELASFAAQVTPDGVELRWQTASETENLGFDLYRRVQTGAAFSKINTTMIPGAGTTTEAQEYSFIDAAVESGETYVYKLIAVDYNGAFSEHGPLTIRVDAVTGASEPGELPQVFTLQQNYPNPFNPATRIGYSLPEPGRVHLAIYAMTGALVRELVDGDMPAGAHWVTWDGIDTAGQRAASGLYLYRLTIDGRPLAMRKLTLLR